MVDLPQVPDRILTTEAPTQTVSDYAIANAGGAVANGLQKLGQGLENFGVPIAEEAGRQAGLASKGITRNADGSVSVDTPQNSFILGKMGDAYQHAAEVGALAKIQNQNTMTLNQMRQDFDGDPAGFMNAATSYTQNLKTSLEGNGPLQSAAYNSASELATQHYDGLVNAKGQKDVSDALQAVTTQIADQKNTMLALARQNGTDTPEFRQASDRLNGYYDQLAANPLFGFTKEKVDSERKYAFAELQGEATDAQIDATFTKQGRAEAQKLLTDHVLNNPNLQESDRQRLYNQGLARLQYLTGAQKAQVDANREIVNTTLDAVRSGAMKGDDPAFQMAIDRAKSLGDDESVQKLDAARQVQFFSKGMNSLSDVGKLSAYGVAPATGNYFDALLGKESAGGKNIGNPTSSAFGPGQFTSGTWASLMQQHPELGLTTAGRMDPSQQMRALPVFTADNRAYLTKNGIEANDKNTYLAHFMGAGGAVKFIQAAQANPNAPAASLFPAEANANQNVFYDPKTMQSRTLADVYQRQTARFSGTSSVGAPSANGVPFTREQVQANPFLLSEYARSMASDQEARIASTKLLASAVQRAVNSGVAPDPQNVAQIYQMAQQYPDKLGEVGQETHALMEGTAKGKEGAQLPPAQAQAYLDQIKALADGADIYHLNVANAALAEYQRRATALKTDPQNEAVTRGWVQQPPAPLDSGHPETWSDPIQQRSIVAQAIASHTQDDAQSIFSKADLPIATSVVANGSIDQKLALATQLAKLPAPIRNATFSDLGVKDSASQVFAVAGSLAQERPDVAHDVLAGQALLQAEARYAPKDVDQQRNFAKAFPPNDFSNPDLRSTVMSAATAYYAKLSASANDTSQNFNQTRWDQAMQAVTGGTVDYRGSKIIVPRYGMNQSDFSQIMNGLTDADFAGARTGDGGAFPAAAIKPSISGAFSSGVARLESAGDGKYFVFSGDDTARRYLSSATGGRFILDLGAKTPPQAVIPSMLPPPMLAPMGLPDARNRDRIQPIDPLAPFGGR